MGKVRIHLDKIASTNKYAAQLLKNERLSEGTIISTEHQFAGKGQRGNSWLTEAGENITLSVILYPQFLLAHQQFLLSQSVALAVQGFASDFLGEGVSIKWPNDVYYHNQKIAGILIESSLMGKKVGSSVIGIGININQTHFDSALQNASSFRQITGQSYPIPDLISRLAKHIEVHYLQLKAGQIEVIRQRYLSKLYRFQEWHLFEDTAAAITFKGKIMGVQQDGKLVMEVVDDRRQMADGFEVRERVFDLKEVRFVI